MQMLRQSTNYYLKASFLTSSLRLNKQMMRPAFMGLLAGRSTYRSFNCSTSRHQQSQTPEAGNKTKIGQIDKPSYQLTFTCKKCDTRSSHNVSKQAYHNGTVLIQCPSCKNRHLIADHLKVSKSETFQIKKSWI